MIGVTLWGLLLGAALVVAGRLVLGRKLLKVNAWALTLFIPLTWEIEICGWIDRGLVTGFGAVEVSDVGTVATTSFGLLFDSVLTRFIFSFSFVVSISTSTIFSFDEEQLIAAEEDEDDEGEDDDDDERVDFVFIAAVGVDDFVVVCCCCWDISWAL